MKIEMGESLFYSWLRHVKECQIVQTNWKTSDQWTLLHENGLELIMAKTDTLFSNKYGYSIYKKNTSLSQLLRQAECDALGISVQDENNQIYAIDVAFHTGGLLYGTYKTTVAKIIAKSLRTAMCIYGYFDTKEAEIIFASPKISPGIIKEAESALVDAQKIMDELGFDFRFRLIANSDFNELILQPILKTSAGISDTNELFIRSYHMLQMFDKTNKSIDTQNKDLTERSYAELKIGKLVQLVMRPILESGVVSDSEISLLQDKTYCSKKLGIAYPLLVRTNSKFDNIRYYKDPLFINGNEYRMCSQWSENKTNNDRPCVEKRISDHKSASAPIDDFVRKNNLDDVEYLGTVGKCKYHLVKMPAGEDVGVPSVILEHENEFDFCNSDLSLAILDFFMGDANINVYDPYSVGVWKRVFNVTETELSNAVNAIGNSAKDVCKYFDIVFATSTKMPWK